MHTSLQTHTLTAWSWAHLQATLRHPRGICKLTLFPWRTFGQCASERGRVLGCKQRLKAAITSPRSIHLMKPQRWGKKKRTRFTVWTLGLANEPMMIGFRVILCAREGGGGEGRDGRGLREFYYSTPIFVLCLLPSPSVVVLMRVNFFFFFFIG